MDPDQTASLIRVHTVCLYAKKDLKSLQEYSVDDINRRHFQMQIFLAFFRVIRGSGTEYWMNTRVMQKVLSLIGFLSFIPGIF